MRCAIVVLGFVFASSSSVAAQNAMPVADQSTELLKPPELRSAPQVRKPDGQAIPAQRRAARRSVEHMPVARSTAKAKLSETGPDHPVDFGVHVHGAGNDPHFYSATSDSPERREAGNGVTAGVRFGF